MNGQQYRYRSRRKTTTGCGDCVALIMRTFGTGERVVSANKSRSLPAEFNSQCSRYHDD